MHEPSSSAAATGTTSAGATSFGPGHRPADNHDPAHAPEHGSITSMAIKVFIALCVLTCASLLTYTSYWQEHVPMQIGRAVMLTVSLTKAFLVVAFFMHLWWESKWKYVVTFPALAVSTLLCVALIPDIGQRTEQYDAARLLNAPESMPYSVGRQLKVSQPDAYSTHDAVTAAPPTDHTSADHSHNDVDTAASK